MEVGPPGPEPAVSPAHFAPMRLECPDEKPIAAGSQPCHESPGRLDASATIIPSSSSTSSPLQHIPREPHNASISLLQPWTCKGTRIFLDICSGDTRPLSAAIEQRGFQALSIDLLLDNRMDLLQDSFYEQLLRLCGSGVIAYSAAAPSCTEYFLLKLRPGGPRAIRTPERWMASQTLRRTNCFVSKIVHCYWHGAFRPFPALIQQVAMVILSNHRVL